VIVATSLYVVGWVVVLRGLAEGASSPHFAWTLASVLADTAMLTIGLMVLVKTRGGRRLSVGLLTLALVILGLTDGAHLIGYAHAFDTGVLLVGWSTGMCLIGLAGVTSKSMPALPKQLTAQSSRLSLWLPYAPVPFAVVLGAIELWPERSLNGYILVPGLVLILAALVRQFTLLDENRQLLETVAEIALRDELTGLANRTLFSERLADAIHVWHLTGGPVSVLVLDIDYFKVVNDSLGHPAGDALLRSVGDRIQLNIRTYDTVARIGGDEFAILVRDRPEAAGLSPNRLSTPSTSRSSSTAGRYICESASAWQPRQRLRTTTSRPTSSSAAPTSRCTRRSAPPPAGRGPSPQPCTTHRRVSTCPTINGRNGVRAWRGECNCSRNCGTPLTSAGSRWSINRRSGCRRARSSASRHSSAGRIPCSAYSDPTTFCP